MNRGPKLSIDFQGGTLIAVQFTQPMQITDIRSSLSAVDFEGAVLDLSKEEMKHFVHSLQIKII